MAKLLRFSGYLFEAVGRDLKEVTKEIKDNLEWYEADRIHQLHVEESDDFDPDGEEVENCDLALLTRHFLKPTWFDFDRPLPSPGEVYRHFKIGKLVTVIGISRHTETEEVCVTYSHNGNIWNRPINMFMSEVDRSKYPDASQKYRFEKVEECKYE